MNVEEERCRRYGNPATVLVVDLDGLKQKNDSFGHAAGDELLRRTGQILRSVSRQSDIVARLGGDEFGIIGVECSLSEAGDALLTRARAALSLANIKASIGIAERSASMGLKGAWELADQRMYAEKRTHRLSSVTSPDIASSPVEKSSSVVT